MKWCGAWCSAAYLNEVVWCVVGGACLSEVVWGVVQRGVP